MTVAEKRRLKAAFFAELGENAARSLLYRISPSK